MNDNDGDRPNLNCNFVKFACFHSGRFVILHASTLLRMVRSTIFASSPALAGPSALGERWSFTVSFTSIHRMPADADKRTLKFYGMKWQCKRVNVSKRSWVQRGRPRLKRPNVKKGNEGCVLKCVRWNVLEMAFSQRKNQCQSDFGRSSLLAMVALLNLLAAAMLAFWVPNGTFGTFGLGGLDVLSFSAVEQFAFNILVIQLLGTNWGTN